MNCLDFLKKVLPDEGFYCATTLSDKRARQYFFESIDKLNEFISDNRFANVYHACATYATRKRDKNNAQWVKSFWLDLDIGRANGYGTFEEAFRSIKAFLTKTGLPTPLMVFTGRGLHLYWTLSESISVAEWHRYARGLKSACERCGFRADPTRTADVASILRPIDTINPKYEADNVICALNDVPEYDLERFAILKLFSDKPKDNEGFDLVDPVPIFEGCHQMQSFGMGDLQTEPVWRACGTILAGCEKGKEIWHECSKKDRRYDPEEAGLKWEGVKAFNNATTCDWFKSNNGALCNGCEFKGKTPIQLARRDDSNGPVGIQDIIDSGSIAVPDLPYPYAFRDGSKIVRRLSKKTPDDPEHIVVSEFPLFIDNMYQSEFRKNGYQVGIKTHSKHEGWRDYHVPVADINKDPAKVLGDCNIPYTSSKEIVIYVNRMHHHLKTNKAPDTVFETFGWKYDEGGSLMGFLLGDKLFSYKDGQLVQKQVLLGSDATPMAKYIQPGGRKGRKPDGLERWRKAAQTLFAPGHEWQALTLLTSAAAPLMHFTPDSEGGLVHSLASTEGGTGKTLATIAGASVWAEFEGINCVPSDTLNARFAKIATLGNLPTCFDEQSRDNAKVANEFVKQFTTGREKIRLTRDGSIGREPRSWKTILLSNANSDLAGAIRSDIGSDAMADRVSEINVSPLPLDKKKLSSEIKKDFLENSGYIGPILVGMYLYYYDYIVAVMPEKVNHYNRLLGSTKDRFFANYLACLDICAHILEQSELIVFSADDIIEYAIQQVTESGVERTHALPYIEMLSLFLRTNIDKTLITRKFVPNRPSPARHLPRGELKIRIEEDTKEIITTRKAIELFLAEHSRSMKEFMKEMERLGVIKDKGIKRNLGAGTDFSSGQDFCLILDSNHPLLKPEVAEQIEAAVTMR